MGKQVKETAKAVRNLLDFFGAIGIDRVPVPPRTSPRTGPRAKARARAVKVGGAAELNEKALEELRNEIGPCKKCRLAEGRTNLVFGEGNPHADLMFIGEAPGREEDIQGRPFVGDAGKILTSLIEKLGLSRQEVYIANIAKCRPPGNRAPEEDEQAACMPFLEKQVEIISPKVIIALGRVAAQGLLRTTVQISKLRGQFHEYRGVPLMPTFHPAYLLRNPKDKILTWNDACLAMEKLGRKVSK